MSKPMILVTGATGKTGTPVVEQLLEREFPVRALAHRLACENLSTKQSERKGGHVEIVAELVLEFLNTGPRERTK